MNPADLFLSPDLTEDQARAYLESLGFRHAAAADAHLQRIADDLAVREALGRLASDLLPSLLESPDPDAAAENLAHYLAARRGRAMFLDYLRDDPRALHVLTYVLGASPVLSEILVRTPEYFHWLVAQVERSAPDRQDHEEELVSALGSVADAGEALNILRRWKRRETLRIGARDLLGRETLQSVLTQLSDVACVAVDFALAIVTGKILEATGGAKAPGSFAVIATGQLGAGEMDYGSNIELLYVYDSADDADRAGEFFAKVAHGLTAALTEDAQEERLYVVQSPDWVSGGPAEAKSLRYYHDCYTSDDRALLRFTLARARPVGGDMELGRHFMEITDEFLYSRSHESNAQLAGSVAESEDRGSQHIEHLTRTLRLRFGGKYGSLRRAGSTLAALDAIGGAGLIDEAARRELDHAYIFHRSAEHRRQLGLRENVAAQLAASRDRVRQICDAIVRGVRP